MARKIVRSFEKYPQAVRWARSFDTARTYNRMPPLEVVKATIGDGYDVVNPDTEHHARPPRQAVV